jgi:hypothetical protein
MYNLKIEQEIQILKEHLTIVLNSSARKFDEIGKLNKQGLYLIFQGNKIIYIGKTGRTGKHRLSEMAHDYRSHTLNRKLLREHLEKIIGQSLGKFNQGTKQKLIDEKLLTLEKFILEQKNINQFIKNKLKFKFHEIDGKQLTLLEHFAISVLNPKYND